MSTGEFSGVDHDLLADYLGGALAGTAAETEVARLVAEDPAWARAHAALAPAVAEVRADLFAWGEQTPELPAEVADRILAALATADLPGHTSDGSAAAGAAGNTTDDRPATDDLDEPDPDSGEAKPALVPAQPLGGPRRPGRTLRPGHESAAPTRPGRRRRRWTRVAAPVALAAAAVVGLGALQLSGQQRNAESTADTALSGQRTAPVPTPEDEPRIARQEEGTSGTAQEKASEPAPAQASSPYRIAVPPKRSGTDYTSEQLAKALPLPTIKHFSGSAEPEGGLGAPDERTAGLGDLTRLGDQRALSTCLAEIGTEHGEGPVTFDAVDYARFQGRPALVVRFTDGSGAQWAWVSGPECGIPGSGSDTRYRTRVG
ncbi:hypothetical protein QQG74_31505 [Micromonospora sp. FIMYZ51]|uniref:hypothetical protein n=1 Tax=Micromonospora sp. FIMYZ51 TaxID=3051832 RepID=UPI00311F2276